MPVRRGDSTAEDEGMRLRGIGVHQTGGPGDLEVLFPAPSFDAIVSDADAQDLSWLAGHWQVGFALTSLDRRKPANEADLRKGYASHECIPGTGERMSET